MRTRRLFTTVMLAAALAPASVAAQSADEQIEGALDQAADEGIPVSLLESKIAEGMAKGIPMDRIADAVQHRLDGLSAAREALSGVPEVGAADLAVGADALESGVSEAVLAELAGATPPERRAVAIAVLGYLVSMEVLPEVARAHVEAALARGPEALQNLPAQAFGLGPAELPVGHAGPPFAIPAPGDGPGQGPPDDAGPPADPPTGPPPGA